MPIPRSRKVPEKFDGISRRNARPAIARYGRGVLFPLRLRPAACAQQTRESERTSVPTVTQALHIFNGDTLNNKLRAPGSSMDMLLKLGFTDDQIVDYLYLASFSRHPTRQGASALVDAL